MAGELKLKIHGVGNAWPVLLGQEHPFYDRNSARELANAAYSLEYREGEELRADILVDAGHGTVQSLLAGDNRIPHCIALTHGHMDHTLSVDWVVQSYRRFGGGTHPFPVCATMPVYRFLLRSYPQLEELTRPVELLPGETLAMEVPGQVKLTAFPVYHGPLAHGASMLLFELGGKRVLFTGDLITPLLREQDYATLEGVDMLVVDSNNRFPWPRTNHWSLAGCPVDPRLRSPVLRDFVEGIRPEDLTAPHRHPESDRVTCAYLDRFEKEWDPDRQCLTILEFAGRIRPGKVLPVHYGGNEDQKHHAEDMLDREALQRWVEETASAAGLRSAFYVPAPGGETIRV